jgi:hypothetical protein
MERTWWERQEELKAAARQGQDGRPAGPGPAADSVWAHVPIAEVWTYAPDEPALPDPLPPDVVVEGEERDPPAEPRRVLRSFTAETAGDLYDGANWRTEVAAPAAAREPSRGAERIARLRDLGRGIDLMEMARLLDRKRAA